MPKSQPSWSVSSSANALLRPTTCPRADGLVEAMSPAGEQWGKGRLLAAFQAVDSEALSDTVRRVLREDETMTAVRKILR